MNKRDIFKKVNSYLGDEILDYIISCDPSRTLKYLNFLKKNLIVREEKKFSDFELSLLVDFEYKLKTNKLKNIDIGKIKDFEEIETILNNVKTKQTLELKLYEDMNWLALIPFNFESIRKYARNTKWCISDENTFYVYFENSKIVIVIDKKNNQKFAYTKNKKIDSIKMWDETDSQISNYFGLLIPEFLEKLVLEKIKENMSNKETYLKEYNLSEVNFEYNKPTQLQLNFESDWFGDSNVVTQKPQKLFDKILNFFKNA